MRHVSCVQLSKSKSVSHSCAPNWNRRRRPRRRRASRLQEKIGKMPLPSLRLLRPSSTLKSLTRRFNNLTSPYRHLPRHQERKGFCHNHLCVGLPGHCTLYRLLLRSQGYRCSCLVCSSVPSLTLSSGDCYSLKYLTCTT